MPSGDGAPGGEAGSAGLLERLLPFSVAVLPPHSRISCPSFERVGAGPPVSVGGLVLRAGVGGRIDLLPFPAQLMCFFQSPRSQRAPTAFFASVRWVQRKEEPLLCCHQSRLDRGAHNRAGPAHFPALP